MGKPEEKEDMMGCSVDMWSAFVVANRGANVETGGNAGQMN